MNWKKTIAWILTSVTIISSLSEYHLMAADTGQDKVQLEQSDIREEELTLEETQAETQTETQAETQTQAKAQDQQDDGLKTEKSETESKEQTEAIESETETSSPDTEESESQDAVLPELSFIYMEAAGDLSEQRVIISVGIQERSLTEAVLTYLDINETEQEVSAEEIVDGYVVFYVNNSNIKEEDLKKLKLTVDEEKYILDLNEFQDEEDTQILDVEADEIETETAAEAEELAADTASETQEAASETDTERSSRSADTIEEETEAADGDETEDLTNILEIDELDVDEEEIEDNVTNDTDGIDSALTSAEELVEEVAKTSRAETSQSTDVIIVLDPGHGGSDPGAVRTWNGTTYTEKELNLKIAKYLKKELNTYDGVKVYMTRTTDVAVGLENRVIFAKEKGATALISIHNNSTAANQQSTASGSLVFVASGNYQKAVAQTGWDLASYILTELNNAGLKNNGSYKNLSQNGNTYPDGSLADYYAIVRYGILYQVPSIIVEHAFINNPSDCETYLNSNAKLKKLGVADATAIAKYYGLKKKDVSYGWNQENGKWYYLQSDGTRMKGFNTISGQVYYFNSNGYRVTGWQDLEVSRYYFKSNGVMSKFVTKIGKKYYYFNKKGWLKTGFFKGQNGNRYYANKKGVLYSGWQQYKKKWYYFDPQTYAAATGKQKIGGKWYYFNTKGVMQTGFVKGTDNKYYYAKKNGVLYSGWKQYKNKWYYFKPKTRAAVKGMQKIGDKWYYFNSKGVMQTGWHKLRNEWYYFKSNGVRQKGWFNSDGKWYYFIKSTGIMAKKRWIKWKKKYYYVNKNGVMIRNTTRIIKGKKYKFDASGACLNKKV